MRWQGILHFVIGHWSFDILRFSHKQTPTELTCARRCPLGPTARRQGAGPSTDAPELAPQPEPTSPDRVSKNGQELIHPLTALCGKLGEHAHDDVLHRPGHVRCQLPDGDRRVLGEGVDELL